MMRMNVKEIKRFILNLWMVESHIRAHILIASWLHRRIPWVGRALAMMLDRAMMCFYGLDLISTSVNVAALSIAHPVGVLLGGNGIISHGRISIMAGVKFVGHSPSNEEYLRRQKEKQVFILGDNVVIGANSVIIGPIRICDNVLIGAMSLVNKDISEPGVYVGAPLRKISDLVTDEWVKHL